MKIILVGASGNIGQAVAAELSQRHEIVKVGRSSGDVHADMTSRESIKKMYEQIGSFDAVVSTAGDVHFGDFSEMQEEQYYVGIRSKLMGQVNLVLVGRDYIADGGSFTLTTGILSHDPIRYGSSASMVNAAIDGFVGAAAIELPRGIRINSVSPGVLQESMAAIGSYFRGHEPVPAARVALAYSKSVEGLLTGRVFHVI